MKEIVVNDSNILIDMHTAGLLECIRKSDVRFHTVDLGQYSYGRPMIDELIDDGILYVAESTPEDMAEITALYSSYSANTNLSLVDCSVMQYAKKNSSTARWS